MIQIWAKWRKDGSGLSAGETGVLVSVTFSERMVYRVDLRTVNFDLGLGFSLPFFRDALLACKLLFDRVIMGSNNTNFSELTMRVPRSQAAVAQRAKRRRAKVPLSSGGDQRRPAVGTLARTRNLILAALRVWELKQGIRS